MLTCRYCRMTFKNSGDLQDHVCRLISRWSFVTPLGLSWTPLRAWLLASLLAGLIGAPAVIHHNAGRNRPTLMCLALLLASWSINILMINRDVPLPNWIPGAGVLESRLGRWICVTLTSVLALVCLFLAIAR